MGPGLPRTARLAPPLWLPVTLHNPVRVESRAGWHRGCTPVSMPARPLLSIAKAFRQLRGGG
jgi:hypothetical protein